MQRRSQRPSRPSRMRQQSLCRSTDLLPTSPRVRLDAVSLASSRRSAAKGGCNGAGQTNLARDALCRRCRGDWRSSVSLLARSDRTGTGLHDGRRPIDRSLRTAATRAWTSRRSSREALRHDAARTARYPHCTARARIAAHCHRGQSLYPVPQESPRSSSCNVARDSSTPGEVIRDTGERYGRRCIGHDDPA
jgi:hypothetical protein